MCSPFMSFPRRQSLTGVATSGTAADRWGMQVNLEVFEIAPRAQQRGTVIWMHGLGASQHDFEDVVAELDASGLRFVFPAAPSRPVTINGGMVMPAWYDIVSLDDPPKRESEVDVRESARQIHALIDRELERGVSARDIALIGFSQGGAMALHVSTMTSHRLAGVAVLSGYMLLPDHFEAEHQRANHDMPVLFCHGEFDPIVPIRLATNADERLRAAGYTTEFHRFPMQHTMCMPEVAVLRSWLARRFEGLGFTAIV